jgi:hypothetical protein
MPATSRMAHFAAGATTNTGPTESASLQARAQKFNAADPGKFVPNGVNQPYMLSPGNGNSPADAARQTPTGQLPSQNGMAASTYSKLIPQYGMSLNL